MSNDLRARKPKRLVCHRCNRNKPGRYYLLYKEGYGWICPECGYTKLIPDAPEDISNLKKPNLAKKTATIKISKSEALSELIRGDAWKEQL